LSVAMVVIVPIDTSPLIHMIGLGSESDVSFCVADSSNISSSFTKSLNHQLKFEVELETLLVGCKKVFQRNQVSRNPAGKEVYVRGGVP
jgi:hypothetical protein